PGAGSVPRGNSSRPRRTSGLTLQCEIPARILPPIPPILFDYRVGLTTTRPRFGGLRWWFICPLVVNGYPCGRRVGKLYLPPGGRYSGCRHCCDLTYASCQQHDKRVDRLRKDPEALRRLLAEDPERASFTQLCLIIKALGP